jgi:Xaa-Pro aminopeptidase
LVLFGGRGEWLSNDWESVAGTCWLLRIQFPASKPDVDARMKTETISRRLNAVRAEMKKNDLDAFVIPRADEYLGEYVPERNERLQWVSGFTGSAGLVVVLPESAAVFVDGRYTIQVRQQVPESLFEFHHLVEEPHAQWLASTLSTGARVGYDPRMHTLKADYPAGSFRESDRC